ncbi:MAG: hypothetical protein P4L84_31810 [Isosphaeraceae bacterium]|nr:hypothetical protein [Isosphaeraceae bacterium]
MSVTHRPRFRIHRLDSPTDLHYQAFWQVEGKTFRVQVWDEEAWHSMSESEHPPDATPLAGPGWMLFRPLAGARSQRRARTSR